VDDTPFACLDYSNNGAALAAGNDKDNTFEVYVSPYSPACDVRAELISVSTPEGLANVDCGGKIVLLRGELCAEQLMPKNFVFYNPEHHQRMISLLERRRPAALITATEKKPEQAGALDPFPLIVDGDFEIPSVYCRNTTGDELADMQGKHVYLRIDTERKASQACNIIARLHGGAEKKVVLTAHIDAYEDSPGASDNGSGVAVLLLVAEMLSDYRGNYGIEIAALNGEDHYSVGGQMDYLHRYGEELSQILLTINIDDVGYQHGGTAYSFYECPSELERQTGEVFHRFAGLIPGEQWFSGDHMIFVQQQVPAMAFTAEYMPELMKTITHTTADTPDVLDYRKIVRLAEAMHALVRSL
jgi:aminopeptidase YwaD